MKTLSGSIRTYLRGQAHHLKPLVIIGQQGVTDTVIQAINDALDLHELIKIKFNSFKEQKKELAAEIEQQTRSELLGIIGNIAIYYRQQPDKDKRKIQLPASA